MKTRLQVQKKAPIQLRNNAPSTQLLQTRPFDGKESLTQSDQGVKSENDQLLVSNLDHIGVTAPGSPAFAPIQAKMSIGAPGDKYEQEADQTATKVVNEINQPSSVQRSAQEEEELQMKPETIQRSAQEEEELQMKSETIQRSVLDEEELQMKPETIQRAAEDEEELQMKPETIQRAAQEEEELQMKPETIQRSAEDEEELQMKPETIQREANGAMTASPDIEGAIQGSKGKGEALDQGVRGKMEQAFGADFSGVKVHHNSESDQINQSIQAKAFTTGQDLFFKQGAYDPNSRSGQELLAHELTHVVQQNGATVQSKKENK